MAFDLTTEAIAHFIGYFKQITEEPRLRESHDEFENVDAAYLEGGGLTTVTLRVAAPYDMIGFDPGIGYNLKLLPLPERFSPSSVFLQTGLPSQAQIAQGASAETVEDAAGKTLPGVEGALTSTPPPPSSFTTVTYQQNLLSDSDMLLGAQTGAFVPMAAQALAFEWLITALSDTLGPLVPMVPASDEDVSAKADEMRLATAEFEATPLGEATVHFLTSDAVSGTHVDGVLLEDEDAIPQLDDVLPELPQPDDDEGPAHQVITGGNSAVNQAAIAYSNVDAPVVAVMGDMASLTSISQTNVLSDLDTFNDALLAADEGGNVMTNISTVATLSSEPDPEPETDAPETPLVYPGFASVVHMNNDVVNINYLAQYNQIIDNDIVQMEYSADATFIQTGGNLALNAVSLSEFTYLYDLIVVGGDILNVSMINQTNVLLDDDFVLYSQDSDWSFSSGNNVLWNEANIETVGQDSIFAMPGTFQSLGNSMFGGSSAVPGDILSLEAFQGLASINALFIQGDLISAQIIDQFNAISDSDQWGSSDVQSASETGTDIALTTGSNALINFAAISEFGADSDVYVNGDVYSDALMHQAGLIVTEESDLITSGQGGLVTEAVAFLMNDPGNQQHSDTEDGSYADFIFGNQVGDDPMGGIVT